ncbi:protein Wnt-5b-like isoform X2 [Petromyzon marinus]
MAHVAEGVHLALSECRHQFQGKRWNCTVPGAEDTLDPVAKSADGAGFTHDAPPGVSPGSREAAFVSAVTAAGVAHAVARACRQGALQGGCSWVVPHAMKLPPGARRGGSGDDVEYGYQFAKWFVDAGDRNRGRGQGGESLALNLHNNEAGRLEKYDKSSAVQLVSHNGGGGAGGANGSRGGAARWPRRRLEAVNERLTAPTVSDLVHVNASPEYCERDETDGVPGTVGPQCSVTSEGATEGRCVTCCDRGYDTSQVTVEKQCGCKEQLHWNVDCELCPWTDQFLCK